MIHSSLFITLILPFRLNKERKDNQARNVVLGFLQCEVQGLMFS